MSAASAKLSPPMLFALDMARANGGSLRYHAGGFWAADAFVPARYPSPVNWVSRHTINALIARGALAFTEHEARGYPLRASLLAASVQE